MDEISTITQIIQDLSNMTKEEIEILIKYAEIEISNFEKNIEFLKSRIELLNKFKNKKEK